MESIYILYMYFNECKKFMGLHARQAYLYTYPPANWRIHTWWNLPLELVYDLHSTLSQSIDPLVSAYFYNRLIS